MLSRARAREKQSLTLETTAGKRQRSAAEIPAWVQRTNSGLISSNFPTTELGFWTLLGPKSHVSTTYLKILALA
ncbi:hypothetical protein D3C71_765960 [compost metagenome]